jgi:hypothetical protein
MNRGDLIAKIRGRVDQCRRLAKGVDQRTSQALNKMADEGEADIKKLLAESAEPGTYSAS